MKNIIYLLYSLFVLTLYIKFPDLRVKHLLFPIISMGLILYGERLFNNVKKYYLTLSALILFFISVFYITSKVDVVVPFLGKDYIIYASCAISISQILMIMYSKYFRGGKMQIAIFAFLLTLLLFPIIIIWLYYFSANSWLSVETCMAILQTNPLEAKEYIIDHLNTVSILGVVVIVSTIFWLIKLIANNEINKNFSHSKRIIFALVLLNCLMIYRTRENIVTVIAYDTKVYAKSYAEYEAYRNIRQKNIKQLSCLSNNGDKGIYVLVIGESETRDHMNSYGYERDTTPWMTSVKDDKNFIQFKRAFSCAGDTVRSLTYALTNKNQYNNMDLNEAVSVIDVANAVGYETVWLSNQAQYGFADTPITAIAAASKQQIWVRDKVGHLKDGRYLDVAKYYDDRIISSIDNINISDKMLVVIHLMGSHANYSTRYPAKYDFFKSDAVPQYINEYDNTVRYTDYVLSEIYAKVCKLKNFKAMIYFSDHGEGIEQNRYHDVNNYTPQMTRIPLLMAFSDSYIKDKNEKYSLLKERQNDYFTNDLIFNSILGLMNVNIGSLEEPSNSIFSTSYDNNYDRFRTIYGKRKLPEE